MDQKFEITFDRNEDHIIVTAKALDGSEEIKKIFPVNRTAEADKFLHALKDARCLRGFTRVYSQDAKRRAETQDKMDALRQEYSKSLHEKLYTPDGTPRSMLFTKKNPKDNT